MQNLQNAQILQDNRPINLFSRFLGGGGGSAPALYPVSYAYGKSYLLLKRRTVYCMQGIGSKLNTTGMNPSTEKYLLTHRFGTVVPLTYLLMLASRTLQSWRVNYFSAD